MKHLKRMTTMLLIMALFSAGCSGPEEKKLSFLNKGISLYEKKNYTMAKLEFKNAIQIDVNYADAHYYLGLAHQAEKNFKKAYASFSKAETLDPGNVDIKIALGKLLLGARELNKVKEKIDEVLAVNPAHMQGLLLKASLNLFEKKDDQAEAILDQLKKEGCREPEFFMLKASIYNRKMNTAKSEATLVEGCKINPENISLKKVLARHYKLEKNINKLTGVMSDIILIEPENDAHRFALASIYLDKNSKDTDKAKSILKSIITQTGDKKITETNYILLAEFYSRHGEKKLCEETLKTGLTCFDKNVDIIIALSSFYYQNNRGKEGYDLMKNSLSFTKDASDPGLLKLKNKLAEIHLRQNEKDEAALYVSEVLAMSPKNVDALFSQSILQMDAGSYEDAITNLRTVVSEAPGFVNAHLNLAKSYILNNQNELAYDTLKKGVNLIPDSRQLAMVLIKYHQKNNDPESAEKEFVSLVNRFPEDLEILAAFGDFYVSEKNYDKAEKQYGIIKTLAKEQPLGYLKSAQLSIFEKKPEKALKELTTALTFNADNPNILQPMIKLLTAHQHFQKAIELCNTQINKNNNAALFYNLSGRILATEKKYDQAVTALSKAFELKPEWKEPYMNLAHVYILQGREQAAINHFETIIHNTPENTHAGLVLASLYEKKHRYKDAIHLYTSLINKMPDNLDIANNLAFLLGEYPDNSSDYSKALFYALKVVEKKPDDLAALDTLGWLHYKSGNLDRAFDILTKILIKKPESPVINYHLGMVFLKQEKLQQAKSALEKAVSPGLKFHGLDEAQSSLERLKTILES